MTDRFWLILQEPSRVPERKGPWLKTQMASILREFMAARPTAYLTVLTVDEAGEPFVEHGPETLQMLDGRSMATGRKHNASVRAAHRKAHQAIAAATGTAKTPQAVECEASQSVPKGSPR